jgi:charged multivesicular body protein 5
MEQLQQQTFNMEQAAMTTENLRNTMATVDAMKTANKEMKKQYGKLDVDKIESLHYEMEDLMEAANEVQESMSRTYGVPEELDEADLQAGRCRSLSVIVPRAELLALQNLMLWKMS